MKTLLPLLLLVCLAVGCASSHRACSGSEIVLRAVPQHGESLTPAGMKLAQRIISGRLDTLGVAHPTVTIRGRDEIVVSGPVPKNLASVASATGNLQFFDFEKDLAPPTVKNGNPTPYPDLLSLDAAHGLVHPGVGSGAPPGDQGFTYYLFERRKPHRVIAGPAGERDLLAPYGGKIPQGAIIFAVPPNTELVSGTQANFTAATQPVKRSPDGTYWYLLKLPPEISSLDLKESAIQARTDPNTGVPQVTLGFTTHGAKQFQAITKAEYDRGKLVAGLHGSAGQLNQVYAQHNAIVLDGKLIATPYVDYTDNALSLGIAGGQAVIANLGSTQAANRLALVLQTGSLPYRFEQVSSKLCAP